MKVYRMNKINMLFGICFSAFAVICITACVFLLISWADFRKYSLSTNGIIVDITSRYNHNRESTEYDVIVEYAVDGKIYSRSLGYYSSSMKIGQTVTINYDPENPSRIMNAPYFACAIMAILILAFGGVGGGFIVYEFVHMNTINRFAAEDKYIICDGMTERVEVDANVRVNGVCYKQMNFIYRDSQGYEYVFSSRPYHPDKNPFLDGQSVTVYVDFENNPKKYYVSDKR